MNHQNSAIFNTESLENQISDNRNSLYSVHDLNSEKQANNMLPGSLAEAVRPWFSELSDARIDEAILRLDTQGAEQKKALDYLGLELLIAS